MTRNLVAIGVLFGFLFALIHLDAEAHVKGCHSRACDRRIAHKRREHWKRTHIWEFRWNHEPAAWRAWLRHVAECESGNRAHIATGNGFYGLVQFDYRTWHVAGGTGYAHQHSWYEQAVRAIEYAKRGHRGAWPVCG